MTSPEGLPAGCDVVVVGSGGGALTGALAAATMGLSVVVIEKADAFGGTTAYSGSGLWAPGNPLVEDDLTDATAYLRATIGDRTPEALQDAFLAAVGPSIAWLLEQGIRLSPLRGYPDYHPELPGSRLHGRAVAAKLLWPDAAAGLRHPVRPSLPAGDGGPPVPAMGPGGPLWGGQSLIAQLLMACDRAGVGLHTGTALRRLVTDGERVTGVVADGPAGEVTLGARVGVLLAAGGFERSPELRARFQSPHARAEHTLGAESNTGDALVAAMDIGAATDLLEDSWWAPGALRPDGSASFLLWERTAPGAFIVDATGRRYLNEGLPYNAAGHVMLEQDLAGRPCIPSWFVTDQHFLDRNGFAGLRPGEDPDPWLAAGRLVRSDTIEGISAAIGAPELGATAARWADVVRAGVDEDHGRGREGSYERQLLAVLGAYPGVPEPEPLPNPSLGPVDRPPFYAAPVVLSDLGTKGGLVCDGSARVLRPDGRVIEGLYACGNTAASVMGHAYPGPGACITPAMAFAWRAAQDMARHVDGVTV